MGTTSVGDDSLMHSSMKERARKFHGATNRLEPALLEQLFEGQKRFSEY